MIRKKRSAENGYGTCLLGWYIDLNAPTTKNSTSNVFCEVSIKSAANPAILVFGVFRYPLKTLHCAGTPRMQKHSKFRDCWRFLVDVNCVLQTRMRLYLIGKRVSISVQSSRLIPCGDNVLTDRTTVLRFPHVRSLCDLCGNMWGLERTKKLLQIS